VSIVGGQCQLVTRVRTSELCVNLRHTKLKAFIPLWILPSTFSALSAGAFFLQVGVQGAWGIVNQYFTLLAVLYLIFIYFCVVQIPIQLAEMSPPAFRATFPGVAYQLGNVCILNLLLGLFNALVFFA
jgi:SHS family lactate transporter-like MFS transporter